MRKVLIGGLVGAIPGLLLIVVPALLHAVGLISSDESQIGFAGVPLLFVGVLVGTVSRVQGVEYSGAVALGAVLGFTGGLAVGLLLDGVWLGQSGLWLITAPAGMIAGGALGAWWGEHRPSSGSSRGGAGGARPRHA